MNYTNAQLTLADLERYSETRTHSRSEGYRAAADALETKIKSLNNPPYEVTTYFQDIIVNDGMNLTNLTREKFYGNGSCTIDEFNKLLDNYGPRMTIRVKKYGQDFFSNFSSNFSNLYGSLFKPDEADNKLPQRPLTPRPLTPRPLTPHPPPPPSPLPPRRRGMLRFFRSGGAGSRRNKTNRRNRKITHRRNKRHRKSTRRRRHRKH
jgi:hypothetical protein